MRSTIAQINIPNLTYNLKTLKAKSKNLLFVAVKANAYGHGAEIVASACEEAGVDVLGVATIEEGIFLRENAIDLPILVIGATLPNEYKKVVLYNLSITVYNKEQLDALALLNQPVNVHLKIDTGMGRIGIQPDEVEEFLSLLKMYPTINLEGVSTHLARADEQDGREYTKMQIDTFTRCVKIIKEHGFRPIVHFANSAGTFLYSDDYLYDEELTYMNRAGIAAYGYSYVDVSPAKLKKVMSIKSVVAHLKTIKKGQCVSYGSEFVATKDTVIATVPIGYGDGYKRSYKAGYMIVNGQKAKVVGRVCMDHTMLDVTDIYGVEVGDTVTCMGKDGDEEIWADDLAQIDGTINYEVLTSISERVKRVKVEE